VPGTGFHKVVERMTSLEWTVMSHALWLDFKPTKKVPEEDGVVRIYIALGVPAVFHKKGASSDSFIVVEATGSTSYESIDTGPQLSSEGKGEEVEELVDSAQEGGDIAQENPFRLVQDGWMPATSKNRRHISLAYLDIYGDPAPYRRQLDACLDKIKSRAVEYTLVFDPSRDMDSSIHHEWNTRVAMLGVRRGSRFDTEVTQELHSCLFRVIAAKHTLGSGMPLEVHIPRVHVTFW
jgi:hypothetical protein